MNTMNKNPIKYNTVGRTIVYENINIPVWVKSSLNPKEAYLIKFNTSVQTPPKRIIGVHPNSFLNILNMTYLKN